MSAESETYGFQVEEGEDGQRLDKLLTLKCDDLSRSRIKSLIQQGQVTADSEIITTPSLKLKAGQEVEISIPPAVEYHLSPEEIPLDVVYEDDDLLVINKAHDMVVHPAVGNWNGTLVHALLHYCGDSLSGIGGVMRPGIVHRLDKGTSGLMIVAKNDHAHVHLSAQLADRSLSRTYQALVVGQIRPPMGTINMALGRHPRDRQKIAVRTAGGKEAVTHYKILESFNETLSLVECNLETGRTHQIRVHMQAIKYPLIGDTLYGEQPTRIKSLMTKAGYGEDVQKACLEFHRQALHAKEISFIHPRTEEKITLSCALPDDLQALLNLLK